MHSNDITEKDIKISITPNDVDPKEGTIKLTLNKAEEVKEEDERVITSKAVATKLKEFTTTETLEDDFLRVTGENIDGNKEEFGSNVGIENIELEKDEKEDQVN